MSERTDAQTDRPLVMTTDAAASDPSSVTTDVGSTDPKTGVSSDHLAWERSRRISTASPAEGVASEARISSKVAESGILVSTTHE